MTSKPDIASQETAVGTMNEFRCYYVRRDVSGEVAASVERRPAAELPNGNVTIRVQWSSLNYKDALAATGHKGVAKALPHVPGVDAAGVVEESGDARYAPDDEVLVTGYELGAGQWGGWAELIRVPGDWIVARPASLSLRDAMIYGTAGFTAAQGVDILQRHGVEPGAGEVVVTGATGGVGTLAVMLLAKLGYRVAAVTGKSDLHERLREIGAARVLGREEVSDDSNRPLLGSLWAGAIDTAGGKILATLLRQTQTHGCVAACGMVAGTDLPTTVYPFILRGVTLAGITSSWCPREPRLAIWNHLAGDWRPDDLESIATEVALDEVGREVERILAGESTGRTLVRIDAS